MRLDSAPLTSGPTTPAPASAEVRPEELTELVERLHRREEHLSVGDVAETLGVAPEAVEATLRAMRSERMPPVVTLRQRARTRRVRWEVFAASAVLVGALVFAAGHESGGATGRRLQDFGPPALRSESPSGTLAQRLRTALPGGATLTVGDVSYTGAPGTVFADEAELTPLIEELMNREAHEERNALSNNTGSAEEVRRVAEGDVRTTIAGIVTWKPFSVSARGRSYSGQWPRLNVAPGHDPKLDPAIADARRQAAVLAANRLNEWAADPSGGR